jgi:hypothetical protein
MCVLEQKEQRVLLACMPDATQETYRNNVQVPEFVTSARYVGTATSQSGSLATGTSTVQ